ncbi:hypothetical protein OAT33_03030 [Methylophilaceae bacterium]|nr:hypothetical protein [Methylophilaceae bacterium]
MMKKPLNLDMMMGLQKGTTHNVEKKATIIHEHWDSAEYKKGYDMGSKDGIQACLNKNSNM